MKKTAIIFLLPAIFSFYSLTVLADDQQTGSATIVSGNEIIFTSYPDDFSFPTTSIPSGAPSVYAYKTLDPELPSSLLAIRDNDPSRGFSLTAAISDFTGSTADKRIHFTNFSMVTLTQTVGATADGSEINIPPGSPNVVAPASCTWRTQSTETLASECDTSMQVFNETYDNTSAMLIAVADTTDNIIYVSDDSLFAPSGWVSIENDIIGYTGKNEGQLTGVTGIDAAHPENAAVKQYQTESQQITVLSNSNSSDIGTYAVGFGLRFTVDENTPPDTYTATITYTLIAN